MDVCIALGVHCECQDGCVHSSGIVKMDVYIALGVRCECQDGALGVSCDCQDGCVHSSGFTLRVSRWDVCIAMHTSIHSDCEWMCA